MIVPIPKRCKNLRYEDYRECMDVSEPDQEFCTHHIQTNIVIRDCLNFESRYGLLKNIRILTEQDRRAVQEVSSYYFNLLHVMKGVTNPNVWWIENRDITKRVKDQCRSLCLSTGLLCTTSSNDTNDNRFCKYHRLQHDIICTEYHLKHKDLLDAVQESTYSFMEFYLRKEFAHIFGFNCIGFRCINHRKRYLYLLPTMFDPPYPLIHIGAIDEEFASDAYQMERVSQRNDGDYIPHHFYDYSDPEEDDDMESNIEYINRNVEPQVEPEEDWDRDESN